MVNDELGKGLQKLQRMFVTHFGVDPNAKKKLDATCAPHLLTSKHKLEVRLHRDDQ